MISPITKTPGSLFNIDDTVPCGCCKIRLSGTPALPRTVRGIRIVGLLKVVQGFLHQQ